MRNIESRLDEVLVYLESNDKIANALRAAKEGGSAKEQELRVASEALREDRSEKRWVLVSNNGNVEEWVREGFSMTINFVEGSVSMNIYKPYGMTENDRIRYFNETYMKKFKGGKTIDDLNQVAWFGIAFDVDNNMSCEQADEFRYIFVDYLKPIKL